MSIDAVFERMAEDLSIQKGVEEGKLSWKYRIAYSVAAKRGLDALWDNNDSNNGSIPLPLVHINHTIKEVFGTFYALCPAIETALLDYIHLYPKSEESLAGNALSNLLQQGGCFYHSPYRVAPASFFQVHLGGITFLRGLSPGTARFISGAGMYKISPGGGHLEDLMQMFCLQKIMSGSDLDRLKDSLPEQLWEDMDGWAFLNLNPSRPPREYWKNRPDIGELSLARTQRAGGNIYMLYLHDGRNFRCWVLPEYWYYKRRYLALAVALLSQRGMLPPIFATDDGPLIFVKLGYLLPPAENIFFHLYSWPDIVGKKNSSFIRVMTRPVYDVFHTLMTHLRYTFLEETHG